MFPQACVKNSVRGGRGGICACQGVHGGGWVGSALVTGGHAWHAGMCGRGNMCGRVGACVAGETATAADGTHPTGMHSCPCM